MSDENKLLASSQYYQNLNREWNIALGNYKQNDNKLLANSQYYQNLNREWNIALGNYKENFGRIDDDEEEDIKIDVLAPPDGAEGSDEGAGKVVPAATGGEEIQSADEGGEHMDAADFAVAAGSPPPFRKVPSIQDEEEEEVAAASSAAELKNLDPVRYQLLIKGKLKRMGTVFEDVDKATKQKFYSGILKKLSQLEDEEEPISGNVMMVPPAIKKVASIGIENYRDPARANVAAPPRMNRQTSVPTDVNEYAQVMKSLELPLQEALVEIFQGHELSAEAQLKAINDYFDANKTNVKKATTDMFLKCRWCEAGVEFPITISKKRHGQVEALLDPISIAMKDEYFPSERVSNTVLLFLKNQLGRNLSECIARIMLENDQAAIIEGLLENKKFKSLEDAMTSLYDMVLAKSVCTDPTCLASQEFVTEPPKAGEIAHMTEQVLDCGHWNVGLANQPTCLVEGCKNCPENLHSHLDDYCFCFTDSCRAQPCVIFPCGHVVHYECIKQWVSNGPLRKYLEFGFLNCPLCKTSLTKEPIPTAAYNSGVFGTVSSLPKQPHSRNELLDQDMKKWIQLKEETEKLALEYANQEKIWEDENYPLHPDLLSYAMHIYALIQCFKCKQPYFAGQKSCFGDMNEHEDLDRSQLICPGCSNAKHHKTCPTHGKKFMLFKCKFCCTFAVWDCVDLAHFCEPCHNNWTNLAVSSHPYPNKRFLWGYEQCETIMEELQKIRKAFPDYDKREIEDLCKGMLCSGTGNCKMARRHAPNGYEWGFGCMACSDQQNAD